MNELRFDNVSVRYGVGRHQLTAVDDVTLAVPSGRIVGLVGESGSGKSTLAKTVVGLASLSAGTVTIDGTPVASLGRRRPARLVFQDPASSLDPRLSVGRSIAEAFVRGTPKATAAARVAELLDLVGLEASHASSRPGELSGGQRQRVAIARALAGDPTYLLADEITSALDVSVQGAILNLLRDLQRRLGFGVLFISHNLSVVRYVSDSIAVMYLGQVVEHGPTDEVLARPRHHYTESLITAIPRLGDRAALDPVPEVDDEPPEPHHPPSGCRFHPRCPAGPAAVSGHERCASESPILLLDERPADGTRIGHTYRCHFPVRHTDSPPATPQGGEP